MGNLPYIPESVRMSSLTEERLLEGEPRIGGVRERPAVENNLRTRGDSDIVDRLRAFGTAIDRGNTSIFTWCNWMVAPVILVDSTVKCNIVLRHTLSITLWLSTHMRNYGDSEV